MLFYCSYFYCYHNDTIIFFGDYDDNAKLWDGALGMQKCIRHIVPALQELPV